MTSDRRTVTSELPTSWRTEPLSNIVTLLRNGTTARQNRDGIGLPVTRIETISDGQINYSKVGHVNVSLPAVEAYRLHAGDVLLSHINSTRHIGKVARYDGMMPLIHGMNLMRITFDQGQIDPVFGYYSLSSLRAKHYFKSRAKKAINQASLNQMDVGSFPIHVPPHVEQRKIAAILSSVDDAIEKTQAVIDQVQVVKRGLMQKLFSRGLPGWHTRFKQAAIGETPETWEVRPLASICLRKGQYGANVAKSEFVPGGIRYVRITDIGGDGNLRGDAVGISEQEADGYLLQPGDMLFARSGATVGKTYLHSNTGIRAAFAGYLVRFITNKNVLLPRFLREYVDTKTYWRWVSNHQRVQAQPNINATEYGALLVPCPPLDEQRRIIGIAESINSSLQWARAEIRTKQQLKLALMSVLLTGELRVTPDPEPE